MNIDFHYYATYYAAIVAGFDKELAEKIAWAAEMVDELDSILAKKNESLLGDDYIVTTQNAVGEMLLNSQWSDSYDSDLSQGIRGIWVPFHFLPGHFEGGYHEVLTKSEQPYDKQRVSNFVNDENVVRYMDECLRLRCAPNSETVYELLKYVKGAYLNQEDTSASLYAVGIGMHVFADTWAHDDFSGAPCYMVNKVCYVAQSDQTIPDDLTDDLWSRVADDGGTFKAALFDIATHKVNSAIYIGHGQIGHLPDMDFYRYSYYPRYKCPAANMADMIKHRDKVIKINNPERFWDAFVGMCNAMFYFRGEAQEYDPKGKEVFKGKEEEIKADLMKIFTKFPEGEKDFEGIVRAKKDMWSKLLVEKGYGCNPFLVEHGRLKEFAKQAKAYRNHILGFIVNKLFDIYGGPPVFDFWLPKIDDWIKNLDHAAFSEFVDLIV